jgi:transposase
MPANRRLITDSLPTDTKGASRRLAEALSQAQTKAEFQRIQCLWLRDSLGLDANQVAIAIGWQPTSVRRLQAQYLKKGEQVLSSVGRGGRRHQNLTLQPEQQLLAEFSSQAEAAGMSEVSRIQRAYEQTVRHPVPKSTVYRMLARHGWRKIAPRRRHPEANRQRQRSFKKNSRGWSSKLSSKKGEPSG